jgi:hypothetical protein
MLNRILFLGLAYWKSSWQVDISLHSDTLYWFRANQSLLLSLRPNCLKEKQQIPFFLYWVWLDRCLNHTRDEHTNHYTTDTVFTKLSVLWYCISLKFNVFILFTTREIELCFFYISDKQYLRLHIMQTIVSMELTRISSQTYTRNWLKRNHFLIILDYFFPIILIHWSV